MLSPTRGRLRAAAGFSAAERFLVAAAALAGFDGFFFDAALPAFLAGAALVVVFFFEGAAVLAAGFFLPAADLAVLLDVFFVARATEGSPGDAAGGLRPIRRALS
ncbi:MAG TPA: hypothetical protein VEL28_03140 [Candidatus Binatia bacterium]|nr:hypothetical protein [Candidatus Binatia bacterium]